MNATETIDLSLIIVSWSVRDFLSACLDSIRANTGDLALEVLVVDSASSDGTLDMLSTRYPWVKALPQTENIGFTRGNNIGLEAAQGRALMLLNPDTEILHDALVPLFLYLET